jgi:flagellar motility protein MotE (MotC chaperone)
VKNNILYIGSFLLAFILVSIAIIHLNAKYNNIFEFDFSEVKQETIEKQPNFETSFHGFDQLKDYLENKLKNEILDSIKKHQRVKIDTVYKEVRQSAILQDSIETLNKELSKLQNQLTTLISQTEEEVSEEISTEEWAKKTAKLIESMDPKDAAKVIQKYSDNEARELIYKMKKNKAAAILSNLNPDFVNRITKVQI